MLRPAASSDPTAQFNIGGSSVKRFSIPLSLIALVALSTAALAAGGHRARLKLRNTDVGKIVVNGNGFTVYMFTRDRRNKDNCKKVGGCLSIWPPVTSTGKAIAGAGINPKLIGSIKLSTGVRQVTYNGRPLYTYIGDTQRGQTSYIGLFQSGGRWYALDGNGHPVK
jgi:predicted lipoprotein with Yx(FWY)xxD motif